MDVKLNLIVICVVLLNISECKKCDDNIFKCVVDWFASALTSDLNDKLDTIETVPNKSADDILLTELTEFLVNNYTDVYKQGPFVKLVRDDTKIYVQTFDINDSSTESANKSDETHKYSGDTSNDGQSLNKYTQDFVNDIINSNSEEITNFTYFNATSNIISNIITLAKNTSTTNIMSPVKLNITENNNMDSYSEINITLSQNFTSAIVNIIEDKETKTVAYVNKTLEMEHNNDIVKQTTTERNEIADTYDFFSNNEIDVVDLVYENLTDYLDVDYIDLYKDTTNEDVEYTPATYIPTTTEAVQHIVNQKPDDGIDSVYPWIAALFVMNSESNQFEYVCDGGLVSQRVVLTAARCVVGSNMTADMANVLVILGKRSLQSMGPNERVLRVKSIKIHENFTSAEQVDLAVIVLAESVQTNVDTQPAPLGVENKSDALAIAVKSIKIHENFTSAEQVDLAVIVLAESVQTNVDTQPAPLGVENKSDALAIATTGWHVTGPLQAIYLEPQTAESCIEKTGFKNTICAVLGDNETTCPSFGGLLVDRQDDNQWRLMGIATGKPTTNGVCFNKDLVFTRIGNHLEWISKSVQQASK